mgnify:CR=1 FL=1
MTNKAGLKHEDLFGSSKMETWEGEVALITGSTSGIGKEVAKMLAKAGLKVFATGRNETKLEDLKSDIQSFGGIIATEPIDLRKEESIFSLFSSVREKWGGVRILINNAGLGYKVGLLEENASKWREMLETINGLTDVSNTKVLLSTHILQDVEMVCDSVIMVKDGKLQMQEDVKTIIGEKSNFIHIRIGGSKEDFITELKKKKINSFLFYRESIKLNL